MKQNLYSIKSLGDFTGLWLVVAPKMSLVKDEVRLYLRKPYDLALYDIQILAKDVEHYQGVLDKFIIRA